MSGFGSGTFGGFGQNNNTQQSTGFGGFGSNNTNTSTGFGAPASTGGFGSTNTTGGGLFGNSGNTGGFGSSGGFGSNNTTSAFGAKPATGFGATTSTGGGLFGSNNATSSTSGFGSGGFGSTNTSTSFGGAANTGGGGLFGGSNTGFGSTNTTSAFGAPASTALSQGVGDCQGTGSVPFQAFVEKEPNSTGNQQNAFQSICFQQPYQKWSPEELRLADYAQGRTKANAGGQAGAFGSTNFGGFGSNNTATSGFGSTNTATTGGGLFGSNNTSSPFGTTQPASTGFGSNASTAGGGLFGAKPAATGGLFGSQQPAAPATGGLFGNNNTSTGFGSGTTGGFGSTNTNAGGLFGNNNAAAAKPAFSFGSSQPATSTGTGFGSSTTTTGTGFGGGGLFGSTAQQTPSTGFGAQPAASTGFGGGFGSNNTAQQSGTSSLFGNNAAKPAGGLFGQTPASTGTGGLFGNNQSTSNSNLFGGGAANTSGGIFGSANKPATTGLFGNTNTQTNTGGGLFGGGGFGNQNQNQNQQQSTGGLFGNLNNNQQKPGGLFGSNTTQTGGNGLFGNSGNQQQGSSLFGGLNNNNQQQQQQQSSNSLFGGGNSMFNTSQQSQQPQSLTASISDNNAFGTSIFSPLGGNSPANPGPLATPLSGLRGGPPRARANIPIYGLTSARGYTTPKRGFGIGLSYSNYGSPASVSSVSSTPGTLGGSMLGTGTFGRTLSKSMSTSSLRRSFSTEDSILAPGAFSNNSPRDRGYGSTRSMKRLTINRSIRENLFEPPAGQQALPPASTPSNGGILKKRVSFTADPTLNGNGVAVSSPLKQVNTNVNGGSASMTNARSQSSSTENINSNTTKPSGNVSPEMEQVPNANNQLAIVREEPEQVTSAMPEQLEGDYWMKPTKKEIENMNREQKKKVSAFTVGRKGVGQVTFDVPVDLTNINLDEVCGQIVVLETRNATVYPNVMRKPPMGKGLNVPSTIVLENSWPRKNKKNPNEAKTEPLAKHVRRLKSVKDTEFVDYDQATGVWTFRVEHFTTYGFPEEEDENENDFGQSTLSAPPDSPTPSRTPRSADLNQSFASTSQVSRTESDPEDTFDFKKKKLLPGAFDDQEMYDELEGSYGEEQNQESFLDNRSVGSQSDDGVEEPMDQDDVYQEDESVSVMDQEMAGAYPEADNTAELENSPNGEMSFDAETPTALMKARSRALKNAGTPSKRQFGAADDWAATLQTTVSPKKQDRALLKSLVDLNGDAPRVEVSQPTPMARRVVSDGRGFATSIDLMNSLFGQTRSPVKPKAPAKAKGFEWPYEKRPKSSDHDTSHMEPNERLWHDSMKPSWGSDGTLVYAGVTKPLGKSSRRMRDKNGLLVTQRGGIVSEHRDVRFAKFSNEASADLLAKHKKLAIIQASDDVPYATLPETFKFSEFFDATTARDHASVHESLVWELAGVLWDRQVVPEELERVDGIHGRLQKDKLSAFWQRLVEDSSTKQVAMARSLEEKAIASLSGHKIADACGHLLDSGDFRLSTLVALIGSKDSMRTDIRGQLNDWQKSHMLSEFSQPVRAIYELLAGNVCVAEGMKGAPEDRVESFILSKRFGLDWRQSFGLRLWYGIASNETIEQAIEAFADDLAQDKETSRPVPWYVEQRVPTLWQDKDIREREDLLWGLLRLATFADVDLEDVLRPENSQLSPLDSRLSWQLSQAITSNGAVDYSEDLDKSDRSTLSFASQLTNEGSWLDAIFVLLHLSKPEARKKAIQDHLAYYAGQIGGEDSAAFQTLINELKIPKPWIWEAKALYMRSVLKDPRAEVECLLNAQSYVEAHATFYKEVAPKNVIELDYDALRTLLAGFAGKESSIPQWVLGGEIYTDFLALVEAERKGWTLDDLVLARLLAGLPAVVEESRKPGFMEEVAVETMSAVLAKAVLARSKKGEKDNLPKVLKLPLTEDRYLKHTVELSLEYYRGLMARA